ncbi:hypothetical protein EZI54_01195 [Marinobacter halodurans]|uniref:Uncharacterized protein n=1 Tax=Marinobacter halodurans TaxID=2528979 RepID=A0ABY1ZR48_9GAMM|nr:hypothetical protein [Marinobacter halodurans]TBW59599.1 hypothetical protein EZI54_01195 [Marinobacter halodurans]
MLQIAVALVLVCVPAWGWALSAAFINSGHHDEAFWVDASRSMQSTARAMFPLFSSAKAQRCLSVFGTEGVPALDFRPFSKALSPALDRYDCEPARGLES